MRERLHKFIERSRMKAVTAVRPDVCKDCGHPERMHTPVCGDCMVDKDTHIVCAKFVSTHTEGFYR